MRKLKKRDRGTSIGKKSRLLSTNFKESNLEPANDSQPSFEELKNSFNNKKLVRKMSENDALDDGNKTDRIRKFEKKFDR